MQIKALKICVVCLNLLKCCLSTATNFFVLNETNGTLVGNISIGSPAQTFEVFFDLWDSSELNLIGSNADLTSVDKSLPAKHLFYPSQSFTFSSLSRNISTLLGEGNEAKDVANILGVDTNLTFGLVHKIGWSAEHLPVDGVLGLSLQPSKNIGSTALEQLSRHVDKPIISIYNKRSRQGNGSVIVTTEKFDSVNCQSNWVQVPLVGDKQYFHLHTLEANVDQEEERLVVNRNVSFLPFFGRIYAPNSVKYVITNASGAVYNETVDMYLIDCDMEKAANVTLNVGTYGQSKLVLTGRDYIKYCTIYDVCYVAIIGYEDEGTLHTTVTFPQQFLNNHCLAIDIAARRIAFADVKKPNNDPKKN